MVLHELKFPAIAFSSEAIPTRGENAKFVRSVIDQLLFRFERVILFMDNDQPGKDYSNKLSNHYNIPYVLIPDGEPKDISDYYLKHNRRKTRSMINKLIKKIITHGNSEQDFESFVATNSSRLVDANSSNAECDNNPGV